jgi:hypothetical protein
MTLYQLNHDREANALIQQLRYGYKKRWFSIDDNISAQFFLRMVIEVEKLFADGDTKLLSVWEFIEEDKLDEAAELIEKTRLSNNANYVNHMEGATKLIEVLRNLK